MKNKGNLIISIIAVLISLVALIIGIIAFWSSCKMEYDNGNAIMSAFSIIVTILIVNCLAGLQSLRRKR